MFILRSIILLLACPYLINISPSPSQTGVQLCLDLQLWGAVSWSSLDLSWKLLWIKRYLNQFAYFARQHRHKVKIWNSYPLPLKPDKRLCGLEHAATLFFHFSPITLRYHSAASLLHCSQCESHNILRNKISWFKRSFPAFIERFNKLNNALWLCIVRVAALGLPSGSNAQLSVHHIVWVMGRYNRGNPRHEWGWGEPLFYLFVTVLKRVLMMPQNLIRFCFFGNLQLRINNLLVCLSVVSCRVPGLMQTVLSLSQSIRSTVTPLWVFIII